MTDAQCEAWSMEFRAAYRAGKLSESQIRRLEKISGWTGGDVMEFTHMGQLPRRSWPIPLEECKGANTIPHCMTNMRICGR